LENPQPNADPRSCRVFYSDLLKLDFLSIDRLEKSQTVSEQHRDDVEMQLVTQAGIQTLAQRACAADHLNIPLTGSRFCQCDRAFNAIADKRELQRLCLFGMFLRSSVG